MYRKIERLADMIARTLALLGGLVLALVVVMTCVSIIGRALLPLNIGAGPIRGIYDFTEIGMAVAVFAFLPYCQMTQGHAAVDLLKPVFPSALNVWLDVFFNAAMLVIASVGTWRLYLGMRDKMTFGETTLIAQVPVWHGYAAALLGAAGFVFVTAFCVIRAVRIATGHQAEVPRNVQH